MVQEIQVRHQRLLKYIHDAAVNSGSTGCVVHAPGQEHMDMDFRLLKPAVDGDDLFTLRFYTWAEPAATAGYHTYLKHYANRGGEVIRRPTGGGLAHHDRDLSFTVRLPREILRRNHASVFDLYQGIHRIFQQTLEKWNVKTSMALHNQNPVPGRHCFTREGVMKFDLIGPAGMKILGSSQRRTRDWIMLQGSLSEKCFEGVFWPVKPWHEFFDADFVPEWFRTLEETANY